MENYLTYIGAFPIYRFGEQFNGSDVVTGHEHPRSFLQALLDEGQGHQRPLRQVATGLFLPIVRIKI